MADTPQSRSDLPEPAGSARHHDGDDHDAGDDRRGFLGRLGTIAMGAGLVGGYGTFAAMAGRYLYPARPREADWLFVAVVAEMRPGDSLPYRAPDGNTIVIARQGLSGTVTDFVALSSTCPHLGCKVHWEAVNKRFFCPCHNGTFDPTGKAVSGPPAEAGQSLSRYPLRIEHGLLYMQAPLDKLAAKDGTDMDVRADRLARRACAVTRGGRRARITSRDEEG